MTVVCCGLGNLKGLRSEVVGIEAFVVVGRLGLWDG